MARKNYISSLKHTPYNKVTVALLILTVAISDIVLMADVLVEFFGFQIDLFVDYHIELEGFAVVVLFLALIFLTLSFVGMYKENHDIKITNEISAGHFVRALEKQFSVWGLSNSEHEVSFLLIKGLSLQEIADVRSSQVGTIKSHCNAIYKKASLKGRNELVAYFVEDFLFDRHSF